MKQNTNQAINIILDFDSTLVGIEGIDFLGELKGVGDEIQELTNLAMSGQISIKEAMLERLNLLQPTRGDLDLVANEYLKNITPGFTEFLEWARAKNAGVFVVTGGFLQAVLPVCEKLQINKENIFANNLIFDENDIFVKIADEPNLWQAFAKTQVVKEICSDKQGITVVVGDGMTDWEASLEADGFICFAGHAKRDSVIKRADRVIYQKSLSGLPGLIEGFISQKFDKFMSDHSVFLPK